MRAYYLEGNNITWLNGVCLLLIFIGGAGHWPCLLSLRKLIFESAEVTHLSLVRLWQCLRLACLLASQVGHSQWMNSKPGDTGRMTANSWR